MYRSKMGMRISYFINVGLMIALIAELRYAPKANDGFAPADSAAGSVRLLRGVSSALANCVEGCGAIIIGSAGQVMVDGMKVATGFTLQEGQTVETAKGEVIIDLGKNGLFVLGPHSKVFFTNGDDGARITCLSEKCILTVRDGEVRVEGATKRVLRKGDTATLHTGEVAAYIEKAYVKINTKEKVSAGLVGLLALIGAGAVGIGAAVIDVGEPSSPVVP